MEGIFQMNENLAETNLCSNCQVDTVLLLLCQSCYYPIKKSPFQIVQ